MGKKNHLKTKRHFKCNSDNKIKNSKNFQKKSIKSLKVNSSDHSKRTSSAETQKYTNDNGKLNNYASPEDGSDSEPDMFSQLVSYFKNSKPESFLSDSEGDSESENEVGITEGSELVESYEEHTSVNTERDIEISNSDDSFSENNVHEDNFSDAYSEISDTNEEDSSRAGDNFDNHVQYDLSDDLYKAVSDVPQHCEEIVKNWPVLGQLKIVLPKPLHWDSHVSKKIRIDGDVEYAKKGEVPQRIESVSNEDWDSLNVKSQIHSNILKTNSKFVDNSLNEKQQLTSLQCELFSIINNYQDLYFPERTLDNGEQVRFVYCLHAVNHALKTRLKIVHHNARLSNKKDSRVDIPDEYRDQGLVRPKILILVPFRNSALRVVEMLSSILLDESNSNILNKKRFYDEFNSGEIAMPKKNPKPEDYEKTFTGDTDDNFKIGISVTKKSLKLYADFYSADIIIASPLGLRVIVGAEGEADRDFDFLASIELLILDQAEIIFMQNWDHLLHIWDHLHLQPRQSHGTNFARVRTWALSGRSRYYRQTLLFSSHALPQISALFTRKCHNYAGKVWVINPIRTGTICQVVLQLPHIFNRIECSSATDSIDARFEHFINKVLPQYKEPVMSHTVIYVPSYFDYVRIRNYFKKETVSFVQICEYSKEGKIARARDMFFHSSAHFLLYSERFHFFRRIRLKGIRHIVFYQPPTIPHFYSELCNLMQAAKEMGEESLSVNVLYTRYDASQLAAIVGSERAARMLSAERPVHMFMTGD